VVRRAHDRPETDMSTQVIAEGAEPASRVVPPFPPARVALLGCGTVGSALVRLLHQTPDGTLRVDRALVRKVRTPQTDLDLRFTTSPETALSGSPDVVVELLGGCEPARGLVSEALTRGIPVVTANKSLLARHGRELREVASRARVPLLYEAAVIAGVPFLGSFTRRPLAADARAFAGIVNGTSNFVLTQSARLAIDTVAALRLAQARGYAEPNPENDVDGTDAVEKLVVLLQHFAGRDVPVGLIERRSIADILVSHHSLASQLEGTIKPVIHADWTAAVEAFAGPAFVPTSHPLHDVDDVENALLLETTQGRLLFQGPGAGPTATAATVIDDVHEVVRGVAPIESRGLSPDTARAPHTGWFVALAGVRLPSNIELSEYFASHDIYIRRTTEKQTRDGLERQGFLTWPASGRVIEEALGGLEAAGHVTSLALRALETR
jgi:homoserine dehydrogenase